VCVFVLQHTQEVTKLGTELTKAEAERKTTQEKVSAGRPLDSLEIQEYLQS